MKSNEQKRLQLQAIRDPEARRQFIEREKREIAIAARRQEDEASLNKILKHAKRLAEEIERHING